MCRSPAEHKKLTNFEYVLSVELQTVKFCLGYVTVVGQYEFRQFNQVLSKLRKTADLFLRSVLFAGILEAKFTESKSDLSLVFVPAGLRHSLESAFKYLQMGLKPFFVYIFR